MSLFDDPALKSLKAQIEDSKKSVEGKVQSHSRGFGFLIADDGERIFIPPPLMKRLVPSDRVEVLVDETGEKSSVSKLKRLVQPRISSFIGQVVIENINGTDRKRFVPSIRSFTRSMQLAGANLKSLRVGDMLEVEVTQHGFDGSPFKVSPIKHLGNIDDENFPWLYARRLYEVNPPVVSSLESDAEDVSVIEPVGQSAYTKREDELTVPFVTIDDKEAEDLDDALFCDDLGDRYLLKVAIADPSELMEVSEKQFNTILSRATTTYMPNDVVHMLPGDIVQQTYSLLEGQRVDAVVLNVYIEKCTGEVLDYSYALSRISSSAKLSYEQVSDYLRGDTEKPVWGDSVRALYDLTQLLRRRRAERQCLRDDDTDVKFIFDDNRPVDVMVTSRLDSHRIVEECMVLANTLFAEYATKNKIPILYSSNQGFREEAKEHVLRLAKETGFPIDEARWHDGASLVGMQKHLEAMKLNAVNAEDGPALVAAMQNTRNFFGCLSPSLKSLHPSLHRVMGVSAYAAMTSPLRRVEDAINHIQLKRHLTGRGFITLTEDMLAIIDERMQAAKRSERSVVRHLYVLLFRNNPALITSGRVLSMNRHAVKFSDIRLGIDLELTLKEWAQEQGVSGLKIEGAALKSDGKTLFEVGDVVPLQFASSSLIARSISVFPKLPA